MRQLGNQIFASRSEIEWRTATALILLGAAIGTHATFPLPVSLALSIVAVLAERSQTLRAALATTGLTIHADFFPWPLPALAGVAVWLSIRRLLGEPVPRRGRPLQWTRMALGVLLGLSAGIVAVSVSWSELLKSPLLAPFAEPNPVTLAAIVLILATTNAVAEEGLWRGVFHRETTSSGAVSTTSQVVSFGLAHMGGIPSGWVGMVLAGCFSYFMIQIRRRSGFAVAVASHAAADIVIISAVLSMTIYPPT